MAKRNKTRLVLQHLQTYGSITSWEAIQKYHATRLSAIIFNLRKNYVIETHMETIKNSYGEVETFARYKLKED